MSKRAVNHSVKRRLSNKRLRQKKTFVLIILGLMLASVLGAVVGPWRNSLGARKLGSLISPPVAPPPTTDPTKPSKEYTHGGGKFLATEDPLSGSSLTAPLRLAATSTSSAQTDITWNDISRAHHYVVESSPVTSIPLPVAPEPQTSGGKTVNINFDELNTLFNPVEVGTHYPDVRFSSDGLQVYAVVAAQSNFRSPPNTITRGNLIFQDHKQFAELVIQFPKPVEKLRFYITGVDTFIGTIALLDWYRNDIVVQQNSPIGSDGKFVPKLLDFGQATGITKVRVHGVTDPFGIMFDDFTFTVPTATPTPTPIATPTPTPTPPEPGSLKANPEEEAIDLSWTASQGASGYIVERSPGIVGSSLKSGTTVFATGPISSSAFAPIVTVPTNVTCLPSGSCTFRDSDPPLSVDVEYSYVVSAISSGGQSRKSNVAKAKPLRKPGCDWKNQVAAPLNNGQLTHIQHLGWSLDYQYTEKDGLVISNIKLDGRSMADKFSVPYFRIDAYSDANPNTNAERGELRLFGSSRSDGKLLTRLIEAPFPEGNVDVLRLIAVYGVDKIPNAPNSCLKITQVFEFFKKGFEVPHEPPHFDKTPCEPTSTVTTCAKFRPSVSYRFYPGPGEHLRSFNIPQRLKFQVGQKINGLENTAGFARDKDSDKPKTAEGLRNFYPFSIAYLPMLWEGRFQVVLPGVVPGVTTKDAGSVDNFHQTNNWWIEPPEVVIMRGLNDGHQGKPGCPECLHMHWRWTKLLEEGGLGFYPSGKGQPVIRPGSSQSLDLALAKFHPGEEHPNDYYDLVKNAEQIAQEPTDQCKNCRARSEVVLWYSSHGFSNEDSFYWNPSWFNGKKGLPAGMQQITAASSSAALSDGPVAVDFADVFVEGTNSFDTRPLTDLPALPRGYLALNNTAYLVSTTASFGSPTNVKFLVNSLSSSTTFDNLRIFHLRPDPFDPETALWEDVTVLPPSTPAPDFQSRTLTAITNDVGIFFIGTRDLNVPPNTESADLSVVCSDSSDPTVADNTLTYTITVHNNGPQTATDVRLLDALSPHVRLQSFTATQGTLREVGGRLVGYLGALPSGASATATVVVKPTEGNGKFDNEGEQITNGVMVRSEQLDHLSENNVFAESTKVLPNPNKPPIVSITSLTDQQLFQGPAEIGVIVTATDSDGSINLVQVVLDGQLVGELGGNGGSVYTLTAHNVAPGRHEIYALAQDNGGRIAVTDDIEVIVNGPASVSLNSPTTGSSFTPGSTINLSAQASYPAGNISKVTFLANGHPVAEGTLSGGVYTGSWENVGSNNYKIVAVATDNNGIESYSNAATVSVDTKPNVSILSPIEGTIFPSSSNIGVSAAATDPDGQIVKVEFYANGSLIGSTSDFATERFYFTWRSVNDGQYSLTAVATDNLGMSTSSAPVNIGVNKQPSRPGEVIWFDDNLPTGASKHTDGDVDWYWVNANPGAFSGTEAHQSRNFKPVAAPSRTIHSHSFDSATAKLRVDAGDKLFTYVFLDPNNMPREIMLEWRTGSSWEHRAYWGANNINVGVNNTASLFYMGSLPNAGGWVRLEVLASNVGLANTDVDGMSFVLDGGRATWDVSGKTTPAYVPPTPPPPVLLDVGIPNLFVPKEWLMGALPPGAIPGVENGDAWNWIPCVFSWWKCHQSVSGQGFKRHYFEGASPLAIFPGDYLFTYVFLDPNQMPDEIFVEWHDGATWHRAFWGANAYEVGTTGTESWRYMGGLPPPGKFAALVVPASYLGLEGKFVSGMGFGFYKERNNAQLLWGHAGRTRNGGSVPWTLTANTAVYQFKHSEFGYYYSTNDVPLHSTQDRPDGRKFFAPPNQAAGTVPFYRFINKTKREFVYSTCANCVNVNDWDSQGIAFYVYPVLPGTPPPPGTVPLYLFKDNAQHYFLTITQSEGAGMTPETPPISGYVYADNPLVPTRPSSLGWEVNFCRLHWLDNTSNETGYRIEKRTGFNNWSTLINLPPNTTSFKDCNLIPIDSWGGLNQANQSEASTRANQIEIKFPPVSYRVFAVNSVGDSIPGDLEFSGWVDFEGAIAHSEPTVNIVSPKEGEIVGRDLVIKADGFDVDGNGSLGKIEFFDGLKIGELTGPPPYDFIWRNASPGPHTLTVKATDSMGRTVTSPAVHINVTALPTVSITSPADGSLITTPANITLQANASDADGTIGKVEFFQGQTKIGEDQTAPYSVSWSAQSGIYLVTARATDNVLMAVDSVPIRVTVNNPPSVTVAVNSDTVTVPPGSEVLLTANASDDDGTISKVDFYRGPTLIGTVSTFPSIYTWTNVSSGIHSITADATDDRGAVSRFAPVILSVNAPPVVSITSPVHKAMLSPSSDITISATTIDDGTVTKVDFYQGSTLIGTDSSAPFSITWPSVAAGFYNLTAKATDNLGATTTSAPVAVTAPTFFDDFNDNSLDAAKWSLYIPSSAAVVSEQGQQLRITVPASTATYNGVVSNASYDMRGGAAQVELVQPVSQAGWVDNSMFVQRDDQNFYQIGVGAGSMVFRSRTNGTESQAVIPFDGVGHRYWRISHNQVSDVVSLETSADGVTWTNRKAVTAGFSLVGVKFVLQAGAWAANNATPGAAVYNDFQAIVTVPQPPAILADDFNDNSLNTGIWDANNLFSGFTDTGVPVAETGQKFEIGPLLKDVGNSHYRGIRSINTYTFTNSYSYVELSQAPLASTSADAMFTVGNNVEAYYRIAVTAGKLWGQRKTGGTKTSLFDVPYDTLNHRFLRIRHDVVTGKVTLDTAPDIGGTPGAWVQRYSEAWNSSISLTGMIFELKAGTSKPESTSPGRVIFDNFRTALNSQ